MATALRTTSSRDMGAVREVVLLAEVELLVQPIITATLAGSMICTRSTNRALLESIDDTMTLANGAATARMAVADEGATVDCKMAICGAMTESTTVTGKPGSINLTTAASKIARTISRPHTVRLIIDRSMTPTSVVLGEVVAEASAPKAARETGELKSSHQATMAITGKSTLEQLSLSTVRKRTGTPTIGKGHLLLKEEAVDVEVGEASP